MPSKLMQEFLLLFDETDEDVIFEILSSYYQEVFLNDDG